MLATELAYFNIRTQLATVINKLFWVFVTYLIQWKIIRNTGGL